MKPIELVKALQRNGVPDIDARDAMALSYLFAGYAMASVRQMDQKLLRDAKRSLDEASSVVRS
jgi:hypothetical protein